MTSHMRAAPDGAEVSAAAGGRLILHFKTRAVFIP